MSIINNVNINPEIDEEKSKNILKLFCKDINKINILDECGWTPLYRTIIAGDILATKILLKNGADPNIKCSMGETPLYQAVDMGKLDHVKLLLNSGANPNIVQDDGFSPLHAAVIRQNLLIIKFLLKNGANPNIKTKIYNQTPVHLAIKNDVDPMILLILVQFNGSLLDRDKFDKRPIDYINSKEMNDAIEKLKFELNQNNDKKLLLNPPLFQTPKKYNNFEIAKVFSNTIRSKSSKKDIIFNSKTLLKEPGNVKFNFIETTKENKEPNKICNKKNNNFNDKEESSCIESDKDNDNNIIINTNSFFLKNKNNSYINNKIDVISMDDFIKKIKSNNKENKENNNLSKIPKINFFSTNFEEKKINNIYTKPRLSLRQSIEEDENEDIKKIFTFMEKEKENINKKEINKQEIKKQIEMDRIKSSAITLSNTARNNTLTINNEDLSSYYLWKFKTIDDEFNTNNFHTKRNSANTSMTLFSNNNIDINIKYPIYEWLKEIKLVCYYNNFITRKIYNLDKLIFNLHNGICNITKNDIENLDIKNPGHIYRIITKMEIDSERINTKIVNLILGEINNKDINILKNSIYLCCGCCSLQNQSKYNYENNKKYQIDFWLSKLRMNKYKNNFIKNGFDLFEYFFLQMFSSIPIDDNILKDDIKIKSVKDRDFILLQINKDVKYILKKSEKMRNSSLQNEIVINTDKDNNNINRKEDINNDEYDSNNCFIY